MVTERAFKFRKEKEDWGDMTIPWPDDRAAPWGAWRDDSMPDTAVRADSKFATLAVTVTVKVLQGPRAAVVTVTEPPDRAVGQQAARRIAGDVIVTYASALASLSASGCDPAVSGPRPGLRGLGLRVLVFTLKFGSLSLRVRFSGGVGGSEHETSTQAQSAGMGGRPGLRV